jgi:excisionase family DNA binding protein
MNQAERGESSKFFENRIAPEYVNTKSAAEFLGISENALRILVCRGKIPSHKFGRRLRFKISDLKNIYLRKD